MAEAVSVFNASTKAVDGQFTLAANTVNWAAGDAVEEPHYFQQNVHPDIEQITQYLPRAQQEVQGGIQYNGLTDTGVEGWFINNNTPNSAYYGNGGTHRVPTYGLNISGSWLYSATMQAGDAAALSFRCNSHGCDKWNSGYDIFQMQTSAGEDRVPYSPATSTMTILLRGQPYTFSPTSFTAGTINVGALNATAINATR